MGVGRGKKEDDRQLPDVRVEISFDRRVSRTKSLLLRMTLIASFFNRKAAALDVGGILIHLHHAVNLRDEPESGEESNGAGEEKENEGQEESVSEVEDRRCGPLDGKLWTERIE